MINAATATPAPIPALDPVERPALGGPEDDVSWVFGEVEVDEEGGRWVAED